MMATIKRNPSNPDKYFIIENDKKVLAGKSFFKDDAKRIAAARTRLAKKKMTKKTTKRKSTGGIAAYVRKIQNSPMVKSATKKIKDLENKLKAAKKDKAAKVKAAQRKLKK